MTHELILVGSITSSVASALSAITNGSEMPDIVVAFEQPPGRETLEFGFLPVCDRGMAGIDGGQFEICHTQLKEVDKRGFDDPAMTDNHDMFALVLVNNTV